MHITPTRCALVPYLCVSAPLRPIPLRASAPLRPRDARFHISRPCDFAARRRDEHTLAPGRAPPSQTLPGAGAWVRGPPARISVGAARRPNPPAGGGMGKPGFPTPLREGAALPDPPTGWGHGEPGFPMPLRGGGMGKPGFPTPLREGAALPDPPTGWGRGETRFPHTPA